MDALQAWRVVARSSLEHNSVVTILITSASIPYDWSIHRAPPCKKLKRNMTQLLTNVLQPKWGKSNRGMTF